jgi:hypothetical protein
VQDNDADDGSGSNHSPNLGSDQGGGNNGSPDLSIVASLISDSRPKYDLPARTCTPGRA